MKKLTHQLLISTGLLLISIYSSFAFANSNINTDFDLYIQRIERIQKTQLLQQAPRNGIICNGKTVVAPKIMRQNLSCRENINTTLSAAS